MGRDAVGYKAGQCGVSDQMAFPPTPGVSTKVPLLHCVGGAGSPHFPHPVKSERIIRPPVSILRPTL